MNQEMAAQAAHKAGFIAALDQSGGSTPKALKLYGIDQSAWSSDAEMFDLVHQMRAREMKGDERVVGKAGGHQRRAAEIDPEHR